MLVYVWVVQESTRSKQNTKSPLATKIRSDHMETRSQIVFHIMFLVSLKSRLNPRDTIRIVWCSFGCRRFTSLGGKWVLGFGSRGKNVIESWHLDY